MTRWIDCTLAQIGQPHARLGRNVVGLRITSREVFGLNLPGYTPISPANVLARNAVGAPVQIDNNLAAQAKSVLRLVGRAIRPRRLCSIRRACLRGTLTSHTPTKWRSTSQTIRILPSVTVRVPAVWRMRGASDDLPNEAEIADNLSVQFPTRYKRRHRWPGIAT